MIHMLAEDTQLRWFKSTYSGPDGGDCVEVAVDAYAVYIRDSKTTGDSPVLRVRRDKWSVFVSHTVM